jgi:O-succinylbenzoate synthase
LPEQTVVLVFSAAESQIRLRINMLNFLKAPCKDKECSSAFSELVELAAGWGSSVMGFK